MNFVQMGLTTYSLSNSPPGGSKSDITITVDPLMATTIKSTAVPKPINGKDNTTVLCASW
jgi:hypothetical protein